MRSGAGNGAIAFQHQQFQEWYASLEVAELMQASAKGGADARVRLRAAIFDQPAWEESIFFAVERVSREDCGAALVAHAVRQALPIDPMLAAEMIYRSSPAVWEIVKADMIAFVDRWHCPGAVDRAVRFMIITGERDGSWLPLGLPGLVRRGNVYPEGSCGSGACPCRGRCDGAGLPARGCLGKAARGYGSMGGILRAKSGLERGADGAAGGRI
jgi:hypothetical protein